MHHFANLTAFYNQCGLYALLNRDEVMVDGAYRQQGRDGGMSRINGTVAQNDIVYPVGYGLLGLLAQIT